jgi:hypothetical protein
MTIDPQKKFKLIDEIVEYVNSNYGYNYNGYLKYDDSRVKIILGRFGISYSHDYFDTDDLLKANDKSISELHEYLLNNKGLGHLFHDKYAIEVLANEEDFFNLNLYLNECFECIKSDRKIATAVLLRCCVEIFLSIFDKTKVPLAKKIEMVFINIKNNKNFEIFIKHDKEEQLKTFLEGIKDVGNDAVHLNGKNPKDFIEKNNNTELLKLFCILIENSILKDSIKKKNEEDVENRVKSIDFTIKEKPLVQDNSNQSLSEDDDIPF